MTRSMLLSLPLALGCNRDVERRDSGVAVGNPGEMRARLATGGDGAVDEAWLFVGALLMEGCADDETVVAADVVLDLAGEPQLLLPAGTWCGLGLVDGYVELSGTVGEGQRLDVGLPLDEVWVEAADDFTVGQGAYALRLGPDGWLDADALGVEPEDGDVVLDDEEDERAEALIEALSYASVLAQDDDADGEIDDGEQVLAAGEGAPEAEALWASAEDDEDEDEDQGTDGGCGSNAAAAPWALLALLGLWGRRREARR